MKIYFAILLMSCNIILIGQVNKYAVVKTNGDTIWGDHYKFSYNGANKIKKVTLTTGDIETEVIGTDVAFFIKGDSTELFSTDPYDFGTVKIVGSKYYLTCDFSEAPNNTSGNPVWNPKFCVFDKERNYVKTLSKKEEQYLPDLKKYFGECDEFVKAVDKGNATNKNMQYYNNMMALIKHYSC